MYALERAFGDCMHACTVLNPHNPSSLCALQVTAKEKVLVATASNTSATYSLSIVLLSDPTHADMLTLFSTVNKQTMPVCGPSGNTSMAFNGSVVEGGIGTALATVAPCVPDQLMYLNVTSNTTWLSLNAGLLFPHIQVRY